MRPSKSKILQAPVTQSQAILDASYSLGKDAIRIMKLVSQQITSKQNDDGWYFVKVSSYAEAFELTAHEASRDVRGGLESLWNNFIKIHLDSGVVLEKRFIIDRVSKKTHGEYGVRFHPDLLPFLHNLSESFSYSLSDVVQVRTPYPMRFYDWFNAHKEDKELVLSVEYIKDRLKLSGSYTRYGNIKSRVIDPSVSVTNQFTPLNVSYTEIKEGRNVVSLKFVISQKSAEVEKLQTATPISGVDCSLSKIVIDQ